MNKFLFDKLNRFTFHISIKIILVGYLILWANNVSGQSKWSTYHSPKNDFSILCPGGIMKYESKTVITSIGPLINQVHYLDLPADHPNFLYTINVINYPEGSINKDSIEVIDELFDTTVESMSESTGCKISYSQKSLQEDIPYVIVRLMDQKSNTSIKSKVFLIEDSVYSLQVYTMHDNKLNDFIDKFINAFQVQ